MEWRDLYCHDPTRMTFNVYVELPGIVPRTLCPASRCQWAIQTGMIRVNLIDRRQSSGRKAALPAAGLE